MTDETQGVVDAEFDKTKEPLDPALELQMLKQRADLLGVSYSNNIGPETLKTRIAEKLAAAEKATDPEVLVQTPAALETAPAIAEAAPDVAEKAAPKKMSLRNHLIQENMRLIRIRLTCMNPAKGNLPGEVFTVGNKYVGTVKKLIPYGKGTENGYHVPYILYKFLKRKEFQLIRTIRDRKTGIETPESSWVKEFAIEVLPQLTAEELKKLAVAQIAAGND